MALFKADKLSVDGVEEQMISYTLEVLVMTKYKDHGSKEGVQESVSLNIAGMYVTMCSAKVNLTAESSHS